MTKRCTHVATNGKRCTENVHESARFCLDHWRSRLTFARKAANYVLRSLEEQLSAATVESGLVIFSSSVCDLAGIADGGTAVLPELSPDLIDRPPVPDREIDWMTDAMQDPEEP